MKEIKKGYRLTRQEEQILRQSGAEEGAEPSGRRGLRALWPLVAIFALMIGLAWVLFSLAGFLL